jgi:hypothetical protein
VGAILLDPSCSDHFGPIVVSEVSAGSVRAFAELYDRWGYGQLSHAEIAAELGLPSATVKSRMRFGLQSLRTSVDHTSA